MAFFLFGVSIYRCMGRQLQSIIYISSSLERAAQHAGHNLGDPPLDFPKQRVHQEVAYPEPHKFFTKWPTQSQRSLGTGHLVDH